MSLVTPIHVVKMFLTDLHCVFYVMVTLKTHIHIHTKAPVNAIPKLSYKKKRHVQEKQKKNLFLKKELLM